MKLEKSNKDIVKGYRSTKLLRFLDDFIKSDMDCAKVVYERGEYVTISIRIYGDDNTDIDIEPFAEKPSVHIDTTMYP